MQDIRARLLRISLLARLADLLLQSHLLRERERLILRLLLINSMVPASNTVQTNTVPTSMAKANTARPSLAKINMAASITNIPLLLPAMLLSNSITSHSLPLHLETHPTINNMARHRTRPSLVVSKEVPTGRPTNIHNTSRVMALQPLLEAISSIPLLLQVVTMLSMVAEPADLVDSLSMAKHSNTVATLLRYPMEADHRVRVRATVTTHLTKRLEMLV